MSASHVEVREMPATGVRKLDVLVVIDDTVALSPYAERAATLPALVAKRLATLTSEWTDLQVAVATGDGRFRRLPGMQTSYLADAYAFDYVRHANFAGSLTEAIGELMHVDPGRAEQSQPLEAMRRALEHDALFVRDDAAFAVVTITARDDASPLAVTDYVEWMRGLAGRNGWGGKHVTAIGIHPQPAPRLDEYYVLLREFSASQAVALDTGDLGTALGSIIAPGRVIWGAFCLELEDLDAASDGFQHECALSALVGEAWRSVPECTALGDVVDRKEQEVPREAPAPACWTVAVDPGNCWRDSYSLRLRGYFDSIHPAYRFECRTR